MNRRLLPLAAILILVACSKSPFERAHDQAVAQNPAGIELEIRTADGSNKIHVGEPVKYEELYMSKYSGWQIELLDGVNESSHSETVFLSDGKTAWTPAHPPWGVVCCASRLVWLSMDPVRLPYRYAQTKDGFKPVGYRSTVLSNQPGKYQLYITTRRAFPKDYQYTTYHGKGTAVTSNIMNLEVIK